MEKITKNLFSVFLLSMLCFASCKSEKDVFIDEPLETREQFVKTNVENSIMDKLHDPDSYQFVFLKLRDSVQYKDNLNVYRTFYQGLTDSDKKQLSEQETYKAEGSAKYVPTKVRYLEDNIAKNEKVLSEIRKVYEELGDRVNETIYYKYLFTFRSMNTEDQEGLYNYFVKTEAKPNWKVLKVAETEDEIAIIPSDFPGYEAMMKSAE